MLIIFFVLMRPKFHDLPYPIRNDVHCIKISFLLTISDCIISIVASTCIFLANNIFLFD